LRGRQAPGVAPSPDCPTSMRGSTTGPSHSRTCRSSLTCLPDENGGILSAGALARMPMKRRDFILTVVSAAAFLSKAQAQQTSAVLGVLGNGSQQAVRLNFAPAKAQLAEMGYVEGRNLALEYHAADDQLDRLPSLVADLVQRRVAVIVGLSGPATSRGRDHLDPDHLLYRI
jgi:hypothetical protein